MGMAKDVLAKLLEVYKELQQLAASQGQLQAQLVDFRDEARKRLTDNEARLETKTNAAESRMETRLADLERRMEDKIGRLETRILEVERQSCSLQGKVDGALATAVATMLNDAQKARLQSVAEHVQDIQHKPAALKAASGGGDVTD